MGDCEGMGDAVGVVVGCGTGKVASSLHPSQSHDAGPSQNIVTLFDAAKPSPVGVSIEQ